MDQSIWALTPLDGRYQNKVAPLSQYMSEGALIYYRLKVECQWLMHLSELGQRDDVSITWSLSEAEKNCLEQVMKQDRKHIASEVKNIEKTTNHDVKAVEYYLRHQLKAIDASEMTLAMIHFACTSEDINNLSYALMLKDVTHKEVLPLMQQVVADLAAKAKEYSEHAMLSRTHGQTASPTTLGKELSVFGYRLSRQIEQLQKQDFQGKINGAVGNYNAHLLVFPQVHWEQVAQDFVERKLDLNWNPWTTQIENHDYIAELSNKICLYNTICLDLVRDIWTYIGLGYFKQRHIESEVGSSTMPHKINPIDFENAEGNFGLSSALSVHFAGKLPISRMQRDLSDSTVLRNLGSMIGFHCLAQKSMLNGLAKIFADRLALDQDLCASWEVLGEPVQTAFRSLGVSDAYEYIKEKTRGKTVDKALLNEIILSRPEMPEAMKLRLSSLTPATYTGLASKLAQAFSDTVLKE